MIVEHEVEEFINDPLINRCILLQPGAYNTELNSVYALVDEGQNVKASTGNQICDRDGRIRTLSRQRV